MTTVPSEPKTARGRRTLQKILAAAEHEFGAKGFHDASVVGITTRAGIAQGTFYIYFQSKNAVYRELVLGLGRALRDLLTARVETAGDRRAAEREGLRSFLEFVQRNPNFYRIILEAQTVDPDTFRAYFSDFAAAYETNLRAAAARGEVHPGHEDVKAWALMGMAVFLGLRFSQWSPSASLDPVVEGFAELLEHGL